VSPHEKIANVLFLEGSGISHAAVARTMGSHAQCQGMDIPSLPADNLPDQRHEFFPHKPLV
jgi:hypothetical protein